MTSREGPRTVRFYTRAGCHLCEAIEPTLRELAADGTIRLETIDVTSDPALLGAYGERIPVVEIESGPTLSGRISRTRLRRAVDG